MSDAKQIFVECWRDGVKLADYPFGIAKTLGPSQPPTRQALVKAAQENLSLEGLAQPPFTGIEYKIRE
jgi:hypothetical protein